MFFVCKKCHDRDLLMTKCNSEFRDHRHKMAGACLICGKWTNDLRWCTGYSNIVEDNNGTRHSVVASTPQR